MLNKEIRAQLEQKILPFWMSLKDEEYGGFYGSMDNHLILNRSIARSSASRSPVSR